MNPKALRSPFSFDERRPCLEDSVFYVPIYYQDYASFTPPSFAEFFGNDAPVCVEYCSGNGDWIAEKARLHPEKNWIAVEKRFDRVRKIWSKLKNQNLKNLLIVSGEAFAFTRHYLPSGSVEAAFINFPDPWPKMKHAKNRLIRLPFLNELERILNTGKAMTFVTDDPVYVEQTASLFCSHPGFSSFYPSPYYTHDVSDYGKSWFETLWRERGKQIHYMQFVKK